MSRRLPRLGALLAAALLAGCASVDIDPQLASSRAASLNWRAATRSTRAARPRPIACWPRRWARPRRCNWRW